MRSSENYATKPDYSESSSIDSSSISSLEQEQENSYSNSYSSCNSNSYSDTRETNLTYRHSRSSTDFQNEQSDSRKKSFSKFLDEFLTIRQTFEDHQKREMEHPRNLAQIKLERESYGAESMGNIRECISTIGRSLNA